MLALLTYLIVDAKFAYKLLSLPSNCRSVEHCLIFEAPQILGGCFPIGFLVVLVIVTVLTNHGIHNRRYDPSNNSCHDDMEGNGVICLAVDILPTEFSKEV